MSDLYKGLDLSNRESMKVAVDIWDRVINQKEFIERSDHEQILKQCQDKAAKDLTECQNEMLKSNKQLSDKVTQLEKELSITRDDLVKKTNAYNEAKTSLMAQEDELNLNKRLWAELSGLPVATKDGVLRASDVIRGKLRDNPVEVDCFGILKENVIAFIKSLFKRK